VSANGGARCIARSLGLLADLGVALTAAAVALPLALGMSIALAGIASCDSPCDGPPMTGLAVWAVGAPVGGLAYLFFSFRRKRTIGNRLFKVPG
jgi:MFS superfamily sulfate permease-like transporter